MMNSEFSQPSRRRPFDVFLVVDDRSTRDGFSSQLRQHDVRTHEYMTAMEFIGDYRERKPGVLIAETRLRGTSGRELQGMLDSKGIHLPFVLIAGPADAMVAIDSMKNGALDFLLKPVKADQLYASVARAYAAFYSVDWEFVGEDLDEIEQCLARVTDRERAILDRVVDGCSSREIGEELGITLKTVEAHRARINDKMRADDLPHLIRMMMAFNESK